MNSLRETLGAFGILPLLLVALGLFWASRWSKALLVIGAVLGLAGILFAKREISATVTAGDAVITYSSGAP